MINTIFIIPIEPLDQRYTEQWYNNIPRLLKEKKSKYFVHTIDGAPISLAQRAPTPGGFLNFTETNYYKATQIQNISKLFFDGHVLNGDKFLITDAWNYAIIAIKYMAELTGIDVEIHGIWHAGAYDPSDILGMKMSHPWPYHFEKSIYFACDYNYFATEFHKNMFIKNLHIVNDPGRCIVSGQPHEYIVDQLLNRANYVKTNFVVWPHRLNDDKQPNIAIDLARIFPGFKITQFLNLSKNEYYDLLGESRVVFSCSLHENLGISMMEGTLAGCIPIVPDRASYTEMYLPEFKYPSEWTESYENYMTYNYHLIDFIQDRLSNYDKYIDSIEAQKKILIDKYMNANIMIDNIVK